MIRFDFTGDAKLSRDLRSLSDAIEQRVTKRAIKRASSAMVVEASKVIRAELIISVANVKKALATQLDPSGASGGIWISHKPLRLAWYGAKQTKRGVAVKVKRGGTRKVIKHAFMATMPSGFTNAFQRRGKTSVPIDSLYGPEPYQVVKRNKGLQDAIRKRGRDVFVARFKHELSRELSRLHPG